jgi:hypothetical protein
MPPRPPAFFPDLPPVSTLREQLRTIVAKSRQLLQETEAIAKGYTPTRDRNILLNHLSTTSERAHSDALRVKEQRKKVRQLLTRGDDATEAKRALLKSEVASARSWNEMEGLLDQMDELTPKG